MMKGQERALRIKAKHSRDTTRDILQPSEDVIFFPFPIYVSFCTCMTYHHQIVQIHYAFR